LLFSPLENAPGLALLQVGLRVGVPQRIDADVEAGQAVRATSPPASHPAPWLEEAALHVGQQGEEIGSESAIEGVSNGQLT